jgi:hypothetical protein
LHLTSGRGDSRYAAGQETCRTGVVFLHEGKAIFFGTYDEMEKCEEAHRLQEFLKLDEPGIEASIEVT